MLSDDFANNRVKQEMKQMQIRLQNQIDYLRNEATSIKYENAQSNNDL